MRATLAASAWLAVAAVACAGRPLPAGPRLSDPMPGTLRDVAGREWVLRSWDANESAPRDPKVTLAYRDDRFTGRSGCNQYFAEVVPGAEPGRLTVGAVASTRMACAQPVMVVEARFQGQLAKVTRFTLRDGALSLVYTKSDASDGTMVFDPSDNASPR